MNRRASKRILPLRDVLARWDAVVASWGLDAEERGMIVGGFRDGPVDAIETYELVCGEQRMRLVVELEPVLVRTLGDERRIREWLRSANPNLGGRTPICVMARSPEWMRWLIDHVGLGA